MWINNDNDYVSCVSIMINDNDFVFRIQLLFTYVFFLCIDDDDG